MEAGRSKSLVHLGDVHVEEVPLPEWLRAELAEVEVGAREVDVFHVFFGGAGVAEALLAHGAAVPASMPAALSIFFAVLRIRTNPFFIKDKFQKVVQCWRLKYWRANCFGHSFAYVAHFVF
jgi:hypothetical protein